MLSEEEKVWSMKKFKGCQLKNLLWAKQPRHPKAWEAKPETGIKEDISRLNAKKLFLELLLRVVTESKGLK